MAEMETIKETVTIIDSKFQYLTDGIAKLNKKAKKLGCEPLILTADTDSVVQVYEMKGGKIVKGGDITRYRKDRVKRTWFEFDVTLEYKIPIIDGWELVSTFDITPRVPIMDSHGEIMKNKMGDTVYGDPLVFTSTVPGKVLPAIFQKKNEIHCDHCGHKRFRTHSMLMLNEGLEQYKEIGSTCVKDFFGHSPAGLLWMAQINFQDIVSEIEEDFYSESGYSVSSLDIDAVMMFTAMAIRLDGWVSRGYARDYDKTPTSDMMFFYMDPPKSWMGEREPSDDDKLIAKNTIAHFTELDPGDNDYLANCCKVVKLGYVPFKMVGVACSMIATYKKAWLDRKEREDRPESNWVSEVKGKVEAKVECVFSKELASDWGVSVLYIFIEEVTGNKFITYYSGSKWVVYQGDKMTLKGTVKSHGLFKDEKYTKLTRCSVLNVVKCKEEDNEDA